MVCKEEIWRHFASWVVRKGWAEGLLLSGWFWGVLRACSWVGGVSKHTHHLIEGFGENSGHSPNTSTLILDMPSLFIPSLCVHHFLLQLGVGLGLNRYSTIDGWHCTWKIGMGMGRQRHSKATGGHWELLVIHVSLICRGEDDLKNLGNDLNFSFNPWAS